MSAPTAGSSAVSVRLPSAGEPIAIGHTRSALPGKGGTREYVVSPDGQEFLIVADMEQPASPIKLILNRR